MSSSPIIKLDATAAPADRVTFVHQDKLPALPVPDLKATCDAFMSSVKGFTNDEAILAGVEADIAAFIAEDGPKLQEQLKGIANNSEDGGCGNWLENIWMEMAYMRNRAGIVPHTNYWCLGPDKESLFPGANPSQCHVAAAYIYAVARFQLEQIEWEQLPVEKAGENPLCMLQYARLLNTCRIPGSECDSSVSSHPLIKKHMTRGSKAFTHNDGTTTDDARHYLIVCRNHYYTIPLYDADHKLYTPDTIEAMLEWIKKDAAGRDGEGPGVGYLGAGDRTRWAQAYQAIRTHSDANADSLLRITRAISVLSLDDTEYSDRESRCRAGMGASGNRYPDHSYQIVVYADGEVSIMGEHSSRDATADAVIMEAIVRTIGALNAVRKTGALPSDTAVPEPSRADLELPVDVQRALDESKRESMTDSDNVDLCEFIFSDYGKEAIKAMKCHPDAWMQIALQLTYSTLHGQVGNTYESGTLRGFFHGRTETVRPGTQEMREFILAMGNTNVPMAKKGALFVRAATAHVTQLRAACTGRGWDRHLLVLRVLAARAGIQPALFQNSVYNDLSKFVLSTSQFASNVTWGSFACAEENGYGMPYTFRPDSIRGWITARKSCPDTDAHKFAAALSQTLLRMQQMATALDKTRQSHVELKPSS